MKKMSIVMAIIVLGTMMLNAQKGNGRWGQNSKNGRLFDANTVEVLSGVISSVDKIASNKGVNYGIHLKVTDGKEDVSVHLGPSWYIENQDIQFKNGDEITVTGSRVTYKTKPALIAIGVKKNNDILELRDSNGYPKWSGLNQKGRCKNKT